jgi:hypothetical protein
LPVGYVKFLEVTDYLPKPMVEVERYLISKI